MSKMLSRNPPAWIKKFLDLFLEPRLLEASLGDLEEKFHMSIKNGKPYWKASLIYTVEAFGFLKMATLKRNRSAQTTINMVNHTFLFFTRLVKRDIGYYSVSLLGLTLSLSSFLIISMYIRDELAYDQFHNKKERISRVATHLQLSDVIYDQATSQFPLAAALKAELPEVDQAVRVFRNELSFGQGDKKFQEKVIMADENFLDVFTFPLLEGEEETAMKMPASIILTASLAKKYFGNDNPIGKTIVTEGPILTVTGVIADVPEQSHLKFKAIVPLSLQLNHWKSETGLEGRENKWFWTGTYTYILLKPEASNEQLNKKLGVVVNKYFPERYQAGGRLVLQPLEDIHLTSNLISEMEPGGSILYIRLFSIVALVIILVSAINLINLSWFKISGRIREVGIRKFLGQNGARIIVQLSMESIFIGLMAFLLAVGLSRVALPFFNTMVGKQLTLWSAPNVLIMAGTLAVIVTICVAAIIRPAVHYATRSSSHLLLQRYGNRGSGSLRNVLVGLQVGFSFVLLVFSFVISGQIDFFRNKDLGFERNNMMVLELNEDVYPHAEAFRNELLTSKSIEDVGGGGAPGTGYDAWRFVPEGGSYEKPLMFPLTWVDKNFIPALNIKLLAGENFNSSNTYDSLWPFIINKRAAVELGWHDDALNKYMEIFAPGTTKIMTRGRVVGIIDDFHFESLHAPVKPIVLTASGSFGTALIRVSKTSWPEAIAHAEKTWKKFSAKPFTYEVLDKKLDKLYANESQLSHVILFFTAIALYLTCYGMFAMSSLLFSSRLKEVAIRKVFGADQFSIIRQFYSRYALFNLMAIGLGLPVAVYVGNLWLQTFQYRIELDSSFFLKAGACIIAVGMLSVSYYLLRIAFSNPAKFLRGE